jgi:hypothetical protein
MPSESEPKVIIHVVGNCGVLHLSLNEWRECRACEMPSYRNLRWWENYSIDFDLSGLGNSQLK